MTDQTTTEDPEVEAGADGEDGAGPARGRRVPGKKLVLFIILPFLLIGTAGGGIYASGLLDSLLGIEEQDGELIAEAEMGPSVYYEVPEMLVNLNTSISGRACPAVLAVDGAAAYWARASTSS